MYRASDYPNALRILDDSFTIWGLNPPNGRELLDAYVAAFEKVFANIPRVLGLNKGREPTVKRARLGLKANEIAHAPAGI